MIKFKIRVAILLRIALVSFVLVTVSSGGAVTGQDSQGEHRVYLPAVTLGNDNSANTAQAQESPEVISEPEFIPKPGEYEGFVPTPIPVLPTPNVTPLTPGQPETPTPQPSQEELEAMAEYYIPPDTPYQIYSEIDYWPDRWASALTSHTIVIARVSTVHPSRWNTPDGTRPANPYDWEHPSHIFTLIDIEVQQVLRGAVQPGATLTLVKSGGQVGEEWSRVDYYPPDIAEGETVFLYLAPIRREEVSRDLWRVNERYTIDPATSMAANPVEVVALSELIAQVAEADQHRPPNMAQQP